MNKAEKNWEYIAADLSDKKAESNWQLCTVIQLTVLAVCAVLFIVCI